MAEIIVGDSVHVAYWGTASYWGGYGMMLSRQSPASEDCIIDTIRARVGTSTGAKAGMFSNRAEEYYTCNDVVNLGNITGLDVTVSGLALEGKAGEFIAIYATNRWYTNTGGQTFRIYSGDATNGSEYTFSIYSDKDACIYGTGETVAAGGGALVGGSALIGGQILCGNSPLIN
jgi:hypothetical protein